MLYILIGTALVFDFFNGFNDSASIVATAIASRAMSPRRALVLTAVSQFVGPFLFGVAVATTVGKGLVEPHAVTVPVVLAGVIAAIAWNRLTWLIAVPSSSSHALVGGLLGAVLISGGYTTIHLDGLFKVVVALFVAPLAGFVMGFVMLRLIFFLGRDSSPNINYFLRASQMLTCIGLGLSHGTNDSQKTMGIITLGLVSAGVLPNFEVPLWVVAVSAGAISLGTLLGGWRLIKTVGSKIYTVRPVHGFTAHVASTIVIISAALLGGPVSTTQVISSTIMGAGAGERVSKVRWGVAQEMLWAWGLTIPAAMLVGAGVALALNYFNL